MSEFEKENDQDMNQTGLKEQAATTKQVHVPFVARVPGAREVVLTGDFTAWEKDRVRLEKRSNDEWATTLRLVPGQYQYRLIVDGEWKDDSNAKARVPNLYGTQNCVLSVS